jgi:zinc transport system ATP-binding protein
MKRERQQGKTILLTTHDTGVVTRHADRIACLSREIYVGEEGGLTQEVLEKAYGGPVTQLSHEHSHHDV